MLISKSQGEKLAEKEISAIYGGLGCGGKCGNCDCTSSGGDNFYPAFDMEMSAWEVVFNNN
jgi:hypothetical protein